MKKKQNNKSAQHFLPRFLLRGFAVRQGKTKHYVYEFRNNGVIRRGEVGTVGYQNRFYGDEDQLDKYETEYAELLQAIRTVSIDATMKPKIDEFLSHLLLRTNNFRMAMVQMGTAMGNGVLELFDRAQPGSQFHDMIQAGIRSAETQATIEREMARLPDVVRPIYRKMLEDYFSSPSLAGHLGTIARQALPMVDIPAMVRNVQNQVLHEQDRVLERAKSLQPFTWRTFEYEPNALVLGDQGPLAQESDKTALKNPMLMERITAIFLPISHQRLLVGDLTGSSAKPDPDHINRNSVELSLEFFVARQETPVERSYASLIGTRATFYDPQDLRSLIDEQLNP